METQSVDGLRYFFRSASPCLYSLNACRNVTREQFKEAERFCRSGSWTANEPVEEFLRELLPVVLKEWLTYAAERGIEGFPLEQVADFWKNHHKCQERHTGVVIAVVVAKIGTLVTIRCECGCGKEVSALDRYLYNPAVGWWVYVHHGVVFDADKPSASSV